MMTNGNSQCQKRDDMRFRKVAKFTQKGNLFTSVICQVSWNSFRLITLNNNRKQPKKPSISRKPVEEVLSINLFDSVFCLWSVK